MKRTIFFLLFAIISVVLAGCAGSSNQMDDVTPNLEIIKLQITPELKHWLPVIAECAEPLPNFALTTATLPENALDLQSSDLIIRLGFRKDSDPFVTVLGIEPIAIVTGGQVPLTEISIESLQGIYSGQITNWNKVPEIIAQGDEINQPISVLSYPEGDAIRWAFEQTHLGGMSIRVEPNIFSLMSRLQEHIEEDPYAIGYTLSSQVPLGLRTIAISGFNETELAPYVLAIMPSEAEGNLRQLLLCVQNSP
jgi:hypothetical protein